MASVKVCWRWEKNTEFVDSVARFAESVVYIEDEYAAENVFRNIAFFFECLRLA